MSRTQWVSRRIFIKASLFTLAYSNSAYMCVHVHLSRMCICICHELWVLRRKCIKPSLCTRAYSNMGVQIHVSGVCIWICHELKLFRTKCVKPSLCTRAYSNMGVHIHVSRVSTCIYHELKLSWTKCIKISLCTSTYSNTCVHILVSRTPRVSQTSSLKASEATLWFTRSTQWVVWMPRTLLCPTRGIWMSRTQQHYSECRQLHGIVVHVQSIADRVAQHLEIISKNSQLITRRTSWDY